MLIKNNPNAKIKILPAVLGGTGAFIRKDRFNEIRVYFPVIIERSLLTEDAFRQDGLCKSRAIDLALRTVNEYFDSSWMPVTDVTVSSESVEDDFPFFYFNVGVTWSALGNVNKGGAKMILTDLARDMDRNLFKWNDHDGGFFVNLSRVTYLEEAAARAV